MHIHVRKACLLYWNDGLACSASPSASCASLFERDEVQALAFVASFISINSPVLLSILHVVSFLRLSLEGLVY